MNRKRRRTLSLEIYLELLSLRALLEVLAPALLLVQRALLGLLALTLDLLALLLALRALWGL